MTKMQNILNETKERRNFIFKRVKEHLNYLKENYPEYKILFIALQGSQNYNLDIYTEEYKSDIDTKVVILPSLRDISLNKEPVSTIISLPNNEHIDVEDIRLIIDKFKNQNINFIEILFTEFRIINKEYKDIVLSLIDLGEHIAHLDKNNLLKNIVKISMEKRKALCYPYPSIKEKIEKYGYDGKQLHHIIRMNDFIKDYTSGKSYRECLTTFTNKELLINAKLNKFSLNEALELASKYTEETKLIKDKYLNDENEVNQDVINKLNNMQYLLIKKSIENEILIKDNEEKEVNPNEYKNVYVTSDLHLLHSNILKFERNREKLLKTPRSDFISSKMKMNNICTNLYDKNYNSKVFDEYFSKFYEEYYDYAIHEHDEEIINRWNSIVNKDDLVYILGDIALNYSSVYDLNNLISRLNGNKILIIGNHDRYTIKDKKFDKSLFLEICEYKEFKYNNKYFVLSHYPIYHFNKQDNGGIHLFGHIHSNSLEVNIPHAYNVGVDVNDYKPVNINHFIEIDKVCNIKTNRHGGIINEYN